MANVLRLPRGLPTVRHRPKPPVAVPAGLEEIPLIDKNTPDEEKIQEVWVAKVGIFDLSDTTQRDDCQRIWQLVCDGQARMCENRTDFIESTGKYIAYLRWAEFEYKLPSDKGKK